MTPAPRGVPGWVERFPAAELARRLDAIKQSRAEGWDVTVLVTRDSRSVIVVGCRVPFGRLSAGAIEPAA